MDRIRHAAREVVAATRGLLDAVDEALADDERMRGIADGVGDVVRSLTDAVKGLGTTRRSDQGRDGGADEGDRVERITVE
jgi:hypothetical protein